MADELDFGSPATSARTSRDDFTTTTLTGFADTSLDCTDDTLGGDAVPARATAGTPRLGSSDAASRGTPLRRACTNTDHAGYDIDTADPRAFATASPGARQSGTRATELRGAALFVGGGCGESSGGIA